MSWAMSSLLPLISEILPMVLPSKTETTPADQLTPILDNEGRPIRETAIAGKCDKMCASVLTTHPHSASPIHHNSEQDAIIYVVSGTGTLVVKEGFGGELRHHELRPGDFAFVPAWTEHQARNDGDQDFVWVITQSGPRPVGAILTDWGGQEVKTIE
ncbi:RmlC-like cupin domain-containing protein [Trichoderma asperelloides]|nr:RmlC-like cupin domain-containing protein [Trichoderma asperelloides]